MNTIKKLLCGALIAGSTLGSITSCYTSNTSKDNASEKTEMVFENKNDLQDSEIILKYVKRNDKPIVNGSKESYEFKIKKPATMNNDKYISYIDSLSPESNIKAAKLEALLIDGIDTTRLIFVNNSMYGDAPSDVKFLLTIKGNRAKFISDSKTKYEWGGHGHYYKSEMHIIDGPVISTNLIYFNNLDSLLLRANKKYPDSNVDELIFNRLYSSKDVSATYSISGLISEKYVYNGNKILPIITPISKEFATAQKKEFNLSLNYLKILENNFIESENTRKLLLKKEMDYADKKIIEDYQNNNRSKDSVVAGETQW